MFNFLADAIQHVFSNLRLGIECPCCGQNCKEQPHEVMRQQTGSLRALYELGEPRHKREWLTGDSGGFIPYVLRHFGLIQHYGADETKPYGRSGMYAITQLGIDWIEGRETVPDTIWIFDNKITRVSDNRRTFKEADAIEKKRRKRKS
jgi:hypothetical protein